MASQEQNELLTRTGPGTPMGELMRRYWIPVMLSEELPEPDCPPVRVKVLSERLIAFRDTNGELGMIDEFCAHRGVSLWFGRNEEGGIRCPYHGWKYNTKGECLEVPSEPVESGFCQRIKLTSYSLKEKGGVIWAYMGDPAEQPELPGFEWMDLPAEHVYISKRWQESNYLQAMEGGIDSAHVSFLHSGELHTDKLHQGTKGAQYQRDRMPKFEVVDSSGGLFIGARRNGEDNHYYWRITQWIMPWYTMVPPYGDNALNGHAWVPIDDENNFAWTFTYHPTRPLTEEEVETMRAGGGIHTNLIPGTFQPVLNMRNDYGMDRQAQKEGRYYSGIPGIAMQDASLQESMGPIQDRTKENLTSTDNAIIMARQRLRKAAKALEKGDLPPGRDPNCHRVRSASFVLPVGEAFQDKKLDDLTARPGIHHTSI
ncbi:Rieske 2Fe-2S domain-containing protein [Pelagibacterium mangrovi]|uniref:Rieske 2Fe-2S domain-containing protein n=1 Tax=Pelagibacterium mangrovi TaxID=3119828 RepID=UPI002FC5A40E